MLQPSIVTSGSQFYKPSQPGRKLAIYNPYIYVNEQLITHHDGRKSGREHQKQTKIEYMKQITLNDQCRKNTELKRLADEASKKLVCRLMT